MSSYFDDASLVMIPSGYKTSKVYSVKPTSGDGDLTFTRSNDTATRVGPDGLIEKVRTNLILQSNSFDTTWSNISTTDTGGQSGYDGTSNAWLLELTGGAGRIVQSSSTSGLQTFSVYAKAGTLNFIRLFSSAGTSVDAYFDLSNGTYAGSVGGAIVATSIVSVGGGWYRCSFSYNTTITEVRIYPAVAFNDLSATSGNILIQDAMLEVGDVMTDYIATTTAAVSVGPVANVPRLDYLNSSCPRLLLEPQRTNLITFSENFDNAGWTKTNVTITANDEVSPDGYTNADKITDNANNTQHRVTQTISVTSGTSYTASIFVKNDDKGDFAINFTASGFSSTQIVFNLINGTVTSGTGTIQDYGNGWYRISATAAANVTGSGTIGFNLGNGGSYVGSSQSVFIYGAQIEAGAYATSYVPSLGAAVTRGADSASKTGISSLIGQTEGTFYLNLNREGVSGTANVATFGINDGSNNNRLRILSTGGVRLRILFQLNGNVIQYDATTTSGFVDAIDQQIKIAVAYKSGDIAVYINGQLFNASSNTLTFSAPLTDYELSDGANGLILSESLLFKTRLTNAQLAELTTL